MLKLSFPCKRDYLRPGVLLAAPVFHLEVFFSTACTVDVHHRSHNKILPPRLHGCFTKGFAVIALHAAKIGHTDPNISRHHVVKFPSFPSAAVVVVVYGKDILFDEFPKVIRGVGVRVSFLPRFIARIVPHY